MALLVRWSCATIREKRQKRAVRIRLLSYVFLLSISHELGKSFCPSYTFSSHSSRFFFWHSYITPLNGTIERKMSRQVEASRVGSDWRDTSAHTSEASQYFHKFFHSHPYWVHTSLAFAALPNKSKLTLLAAHPNRQNFVAFLFHTEFSFMLTQLFLYSSIQPQMNLPTNFHCFFSLTSAKFFKGVVRLIRAKKAYVL